MFILWILLPRQARAGLLCCPQTPGPSSLKEVRFQFRLEIQWWRRVPPPPPAPRPLAYCCFFSLRVFFINWEEKHPPPFFLFLLPISPNGRYFFPPTHTQWCVEGGYACMQNASPPPSVSSGRRPHVGSDHLRGQKVGGCKEVWKSNSYLHAGVQYLFCIAYVTAPCMFFLKKNVADGIPEGKNLFLTYSRF